MADQLNKILLTLTEQSMKSYRRKAESLVIEGSGWEHNVALHSTDLQSQLETLAQNCKDKLLAEVS